MTRLDPWKAAPEAMKQMVDYAMANAEGVDRTIAHLVKIRASQINGCALCLHMHIGEGRKDGERDERMYLLDAWRDAPIYTARERAALAWTEALTLLDPKTDYASLRGRLRESFSDEEIGALTATIGMINLWNRIQVSAH